MSLTLRERQTVYSGRKVNLQVLHYDRDEDGSRVKLEVVVHPGAVVILAMPDPQTVLLIRNRRHAIDQDLIELPAGTLEPKEDPINCAGRELQEETGYLASRIKPIGSFFASPGILTEKLYAFLATDLKQGRQQLDANEMIEVLPTRVDDALEMIRTGQIQDSKTIATLLMFDRFYRR